MATRARRRDSGSAERLRALTRRAYLATNGHLDLEDEPPADRPESPAFEEILHGTASSDAGRETSTPRLAGTGSERGAGRGETSRRSAEARGRAVPRWGVAPRAVLAAVLVLGALAGVLVARSLLHAGQAAQPLSLPAAAPTGRASSQATEPPSAAVEQSPRPPAAGEPTAAETPENSTSENSASPGSEALVHVAGEVADPGIVAVPAGARVADVVERAGGATARAELGAINLARVVVDGEQVFVPAVGEATPGVQAGASAAEPGPSGGGGAAGEAQAAVVDLNAADRAALETLPGVGPAIAQRILDWREANGGFHSVEELVEVPGIGPATMERLRPLVTV